MRTLKTARNAGSFTADLRRQAERRWDRCQPGSIISAAEKKPRSFTQIPEFDKAMPKLVKLPKEAIERAEKDESLKGKNDRQAGREAEWGE
jgi:hypothetical protein